MLHVGPDVNDIGEDESEIEKYFPSWCPKSYKDFTLFCIFSSSKFPNLEIKSLQPVFRWIKQELGMNEQVKVLPSNLVQSQKQVPKSGLTELSKIEAKRLNEKLKDSW